MASKFTLVGAFKEVKENESLSLEVRRNYRNYDGDYEFDCINILLGLGVSNTLISNLRQDEILSVYGRVETNHEKQFVLIAEQIDRLSDL